MASNMTSAQAPGGASPAHDAAPQFLPVSALEAAARSGIRAIPDIHARLRDTAYGAFARALSMAQADSPKRMPWEDADKVTSITRDGAITALKALDQELKHAGKLTQPEYAKYAAALEKALSRNSPDSGKPRGKYERQCARPGCGVTFHTDQPTAKYCGDSCRQLAYRQAKRAKAEVHSPDLVP
jgi:hypothetical protein